MSFVKATVRELPEVLPIQCPATGDMFSTATHVRCCKAGQVNDSNGMGLYERMKGIKYFEPHL
jgi:hypothetical protein